MNRRCLEVVLDSLQTALALGYSALALGYGALALSYGALALSYGDAFSVLGAAQ